MRPPKPVPPENFDPLVINDENFAYYNRWRMHQGLRPVARDAYERAVENERRGQAHRESGGETLGEWVERLDREARGQVD